MTRKEEIKEQMKRLQNELDVIEKEEQEISRHQRMKERKFCLVCKNRDKKNDFFIADGIICTHPSNQEGKKKYKCYSCTCQFWEYESE